MKNCMVACFGAFFTIHPLGKCATRSPALRPPRHAALLLLAGWQPASSRALPGTAGAALASTPN